MYARCVRGVEALEQMVLLVDSSQPGWPVLYASAACRSALGLPVQPPVQLVVQPLEPADAEGSTAGGDCGVEAAAGAPIAGEQEAPILLDQLVVAQRQADFWRTAGVSRAATGGCRGGAATVASAHQRLHLQCRMC